MVAKQWLVKRWSRLWVGSRLAAETQLVSATALTSLRQRIRGGADRR